MDLRRATADDADRLARLGRAAFDAAFAGLYSAPDLAAFHAAERSAGRYREQLTDPAVRVALLETDGEPLAYALIALGKAFDAAPPARRPVTLGQLYCAAGQPGRGLGTRLMGWVLDEARGWRADAVQLSVYSENHGAQRFYARHGFAKVADIHFWVGSQRDDEFLLERRL